MEKAIISGVTHDTSEAKVTVHGVADRPGIAGRLFETIAEAGINVDMIVQNVSRAGHTDISFTVPREEIEPVKKALEPLMRELDADGIEADAAIAKISLIGAGMKSHPGVAAGMFRTLAEAGVNIEMISTSTIRISCVIREADIERAVRAIHDHFALLDEAVAREQHPAS